MHGSISKILELAFKIILFKTVLYQNLYFNTVLEQLLLTVLLSLYILGTCHCDSADRLLNEFSFFMYVLFHIVLAWRWTKVGGRNLSLYNKRSRKSVLVVMGDFLYFYDWRANRMFRIRFNVGLYKRRFCRSKRLAASKYRPFLVYFKTKLDVFQNHSIPLWHCRHIQIADMYSTMVWDKIQGTAFGTHSQASVCVSIVRPSIRPELLEAAVILLAVRYLCPHRIIIPVVHLATL
jgi:hypothetical protein